MARWSEVEAEAPELAALARRCLDAHVHKTMATLRRDGSPRISGTEVEFTDGDLWIGSMWEAVKALDLRRDPRFALHSASGTMPPGPGGQPGDAKLAGRMEEITDPNRVAEINGPKAPGRSHLFRADITELVVTRVAGDPPDHLLIESWHPGRGVTVQKR
jgi:Pyridoxamine 5'-phosphate oxidase